MTAATPERPAPALRVLRAPNPSPMTLDGTRTFLLGTERVLVIDPGPVDEAHLAAIAAAGPVTAILLTHAHADHSAGAARLREITGAPVLMGRGAIAPPPVAVDRWLEDGDRLEVDAGEAVAIHTPGHAPEHVCVLWRGDAAPLCGALFAGDLLMGAGDTTLISPPEGDVGAYLRSLDRVEALDVGIIHPAHGPPLRPAREGIQRHRRHREERLDALRALLATSPLATAAELVERVYGTELAPALRAAAEGSLAAMLEYLRREA